MYLSMVYQNLDVLNIKPDKFLVSMNKNGMIFSEEVSKIQTQIDSLDENVDNSIHKLIKIFRTFY